MINLGSGVAAEMPKYQSHKKVWALKIKSIEDKGENRDIRGNFVITPEEDGYAPFRVDADYMNKHKPQVGGYYVVYEDGYKSWSPADAFEAGNTLIVPRVEEPLVEKDVVSEYCESLSGLLYDGYCRAVGGVAFNGDPLPVWSEFGEDPKKQKQANAWRKVAAMAISYSELQPIPKPTED